MERSAGLPSQKQVIELLDGEFARAGYEIEDVVIDVGARPPRITVVADGDEGLDLDSIAALSRSASALLDAVDDRATPYVLEITSPGVDRPLTTEKHYRRAQGRKVELTLSDGSTVSGRLGETHSGAVRLVVREGRQATFAVRELDLDSITKAVVQVEFSPPNQRELELAGQPGKGGTAVNIDMAALHAIEADKGISVDVVVETIKSALLTAYRHTEGHEADARIEIDRKTGLVKVMARETDADGNLISEWDDTPEGFGRIAATTARQVILQRLRDAENEKNYGEFSAREGDIVGGVIQRDARANARAQQRASSESSDQCARTCAAADKSDSPFGGAALASDVAFFVEAFAVFRRRGCEQAAQLVALAVRRNQAIKSDFDNAGAPPTLGALRRFDMALDQAARRYQRASARIGNGYDDTRFETVGCLRSLGIQRRLHLADEQGAIGHTTRACQ